MTEDEFSIITRAYERRINKLAWLNGMYTNNALGCVLGNVLAKKGSTPINYPSTPYAFEDSESNQKAISTYKKEEILQQALCDIY